MHRLPLLALLLVPSPSWALLTYPLDEERHRPAGVVPPSQDAFYEVPPNLGDVDRGTILRHRRPRALLGVLGISNRTLQDGHQILYKTQEDEGAPTATVLTILVPPNPNWAKLLSVQMAEDAAFLDCAPSYTLQTGSDAGGLAGDNALRRIELLVVAAALEKGWVVIVPDYLGPKAAFMSTGTGAKAVLDGIRAAVGSAQRPHNLTGILPRPRVALWGYSGGGTVTARAVQDQAAYAKELHITGAAMGGISASLRDLIRQVNYRRDAGIGVAAIAGLANEYPVFDMWVRENLRPRYAALYDRVRTQCTAANLADFERMDIKRIFRSRFFTEGGHLSKMSRTVGLKRRSSLQAPALVYESRTDDLFHRVDMKELMEFWCSKDGRPVWGRWGSVRLERDSIRDRVPLGVAYGPRAFAYLSDVLDGKVWLVPCSERKVSSQNYMAYGMLPDFYRYAMKRLLEPLITRPEYETLGEDVDKVLKKEKKKDKAEDKLRGKDWEVASEDEQREKDWQDRQLRKLSNQRHDSDKPKEKEKARDRDKVEDRLRAKEWAVASEGERRGKDWQDRQLRKLSNQRHSYDKQKDKEEAEEEAEREKEAEEGAEEAEDGEKQGEQEEGDK